MKLIVVESPTKAKHIRSMVGSGYRVVPTLGHLYDLPARDLGLDVGNGFSPQWQPVAKKREIIKQIREEAKAADKIFVASDPDREGEGIARQVFDLLPKEVRKKAVRAEFKEITQSGILRGLSEARQLDNDLAMSQQARRVMDRLVGFEVSKLLWSALRGKKYIGLSAGRVQSAALKLLSLKEQEITGFYRREYWSVDAEFTTHDGQSFMATLTHWNGVSLDNRPLSSQDEVSGLLRTFEELDYKVSDTSNRRRTEYPPAPLITSTLLQSASSKFGFDTKKTMRLAQELFEGIEVEGRVHGLITYMRTDSPRVSDEAQAAARAFIDKTYGMHLVPTVPYQFEAKEGAQDGHECIRPTDFALLPSKAKKFLNQEQYLLYHLIFERFILSQMAPSVSDEYVAVVTGEGSGEQKAVYRAFSSKTIIPGWKEMIDDADGENSFQKALETLLQGDEVTPTAVQSKQHFTRPPAHYSEASLIQTLERMGIGRPSTYASIVDTLLSRNYAERHGKKIVITQVGLDVSSALERVFPSVVNLKFTAEMENMLDRIGLGEIDWVSVVQSVYDEILFAQARC